MFWHFPFHDNFFEFKERKTKGVQIQWSNVKFISSMQGNKETPLNRYFTCTVYVGPRMKRWVNSFQ